MTKLNMDTLLDDQPDWLPGLPEPPDEVAANIH